MSQTTRPTTRCCICRTQERAWLWQPLGPDPDGTFSTPGSHYRGFPTIPCCDACRERIDAGETVAFRWHKVDVIALGGRLLRADQQSSATQA